MAQARGKRNFATSNPRVVMTEHRRLAVPVFQRPVRALLSSALILAGTPFGAELLAQDPPRATSQPATPAAPVDPKLAALKSRPVLGPKVALLGLRTASDSEVVSLRVERAR